MAKRPTPTARRRAHSSDRVTKPAPAAPVAHGGIMKLVVAVIRPDRLTMVPKLYGPKFKD